MIKIQKLDNFLEPNLRMIFIYIGFPFVLGFLQSLNSFINLRTFLMMIFCLLISIACFVLVKSKKALIVDERRLFNGIVFYQKILLRKEVDTNEYVIGSVKRLDKSSNNWLWFAPIMSLLKNFDGFSIQLHNENKNVIAKSQIWLSDKLKIYCIFIRYVSYTNRYPQAEKPTAH